MADRYIDYFEVEEYGSHFVRESPRLDGLSPLVNVPAARDKVAGTMTAVGVELQKTGITRSDLRTGRSSTDDATTATRDSVVRFFYFLRSVPESAAVDVEAFFPGNELGDLSTMKPADVKGVADHVLRAFQIPAHAANPALFGWQPQLAAARDSLAAALGAKGSAHGTKILATASLTAARKDFLVAYGMAKRLVRGLLTDLGRSDEYKLFFLDLQVNEVPPAKETPVVTPAPTTPDGTRSTTTTAPATTTGGAPRTTP